MLPVLIEVPQAGPKLSLGDGTGRCGLSWPDMRAELTVEPGYS
jgi:hypothetical protein